MKNKLAWLLLLALLSTAVSAQSRWSIAPTVGLLIGQDEYQRQRSNADFIHYSVHNQGLIVGVTGHYVLTPHFDLSVGLGVTLIATDEQRQSGQPYQTFGVKSTTGYAQLPVLVNYRLLANRLSPYLSLGACLANYNRLSNKGQINTSALAGIGIDYRLGSTLSLLIQPTGSYLLKQVPAEDNSVFGPYHSYQFGLQTQLIWQLH